MATIQSFSKGNGADLRKAAPPSMASFERAILNPALATVNNDLTGGCAAGATITGPTQTRTNPQNVCVAGWASANGTIAIETSSDGGTTWPNSDSDAVVAGEYVNFYAVPVAGANRYRLKFTAGPVGASKVTFSSQARA